MKRFRIGIFASGTGSNALNLIRYFTESPDVEIVFVLSNKANAPVLDLAKNNGVQTVVVTNEAVADGSTLLKLCSEVEIDLIVLAGFLRKLPVELVQGYRDRIINIHPSLLPKYGGKGMYGRHVHEAVLAAGEKESGITIHLVNEEFDKGRILAQFTCNILEGTTVESLEGDIRSLELAHFPRTIKEFIRQQDV